MYTTAQRQRNQLNEPQAANIWYFLRGKIFELVGWIWTKLKLKHNLDTTVCQNKEVKEMPVARRCELFAPLAVLLYIIILALFH